MRSRPEIPPGTLYMLILKSLARIGPMHGYGIAQYIQQISEDVLQVEEGSLYPALQRMLIKDWVVAEWKHQVEGYLAGEGVACRIRQQDRQQRQRVQQQIGRAHV